MDLLTRMETFVRVVEVGSFSAAARQLRLSVAAVSRHVASLESDLEASLVARTTRKLSITPAGRLYYERCLRVLREVDEAQATGRLGVAGPLRLSVPVSLGVLAGEALVHALLERHPQLRIDLRLEDRIIDLALEGVDIAIRVGAQPPLSSTIISVPLARLTRIVVASPAYIARHGEPLKPLDLARHAALSSTGSGMTDVWTLVDAERAVRVRLVTRLSSNAGPLLRDAALRGSGVALLPDWFVAQDVKAGRLRRLLPRWAAEPTAMYALYRAALRGEQRVKVVIEQLREVLGERADLASIARRRIS